MRTTDHYDRQKDVHLFLVQGLQALMTELYRFFSDFMHILWNIRFVFSTMRSGFHYVEVYVDGFAP